MLIRFNIKNFLSFFETKEGKSIEFSMIAGKVTKKSERIYEDGKIKLLKLAAIYGANASGKSNLVNAMQFMRFTILGGHLPRGHERQYCKINDENRERSSYFELEIKLGKKYYAYGFEVILNKSKFISEWLIELNPKGKDKTIFVRDIEQASIEFGTNIRNGEYREKIEIYGEDVAGDSGVLFLTVMNQNKKTLYQEDSEISIFRKLYMWVQNEWNIHYPDRPISNYSYLNKKDNVEEVCRIISSFGTGITDFEMVNTPVESLLKELPPELREELMSSILSGMDELRANINSEQQRKMNVGFIMRTKKEFFILKKEEDEIVCKTIKFKHENKNILFDFSEESDGTIRILDLLEVLLSKEGKTYVIDELDRCLHPNLTYRFIELFLELATEKNIQLIVTTHESGLLNFNLLRRDEIWFVNKKETGESEIYSLEEYNTRFDKKIDKAYLEGRYGGVPIFDTLFPIGKGE